MNKITLYEDRFHSCLIIKLRIQSDSQIIGPFDFYHGNQAQSSWGPINLDKFLKHSRTPYLNFILQK